MIHSQQVKLLNSLSTYNLKKVLLDYDNSYINSTYNGNCILSLFAIDCIKKLNQKKPSYFNKFWIIYDKLIELGANPNITEESTGRTILHTIIEAGCKHKEFIEHIFKKCNLNQKDYQGLSVLGYALKYDNYYVAEKIIKEPSFEITEDNIMETAKYCNQLNIIDRMFSLKNIDYSKIKNNEKSNLFHLAIIHSNSEVFPFLIEKSINPFEKNLYNKQPFEYNPESVSKNKLLQKYMDYFALKQKLNKNTKEITTALNHKNKI